MQFNSYICVSVLYTVCCFYCFCSATLFWYGSVNSRPLNPPVFVRHHQNFQGKDSGENSWQLPAGLDVPIESTCYYLNVQKRPHSTNTLADLQSYHIIGSLTEMWPLCTRRKEMLVIALFIYLLLLMKTRWNSLALEGSPSRRRKTPISNQLALQVGGWT